VVQLELVRRGVAIVDRRWRLFVAGPALAELVIVIEVDRRGAGRPFGTAELAAALVLAPAAVVVAARIGGRIAGPRLAVGSAVAYVVLPYLARAYSYGHVIAVYDHRVIPALLGLRQTGLLAIGVGCGLAVGIAPRRLAAAAGLVAAVVAAALWIDGAWSELFANFHESEWSPTLLIFLPIAAVVGVGRRAPLLAAALGGWLAVAVLRGVHRPYAGGGFWLSLVTAAPAIAVLLSALPLLVPPLRLPARAPAPDRAPDPDPEPGVR
jgi:hypothetical protein